MKIVVFSSRNKFHSEIPAVVSMFERGLGTYHLRKPKFSTRELEEYILSVPENYRNRIIIHSHHELASAYGLKGIHYSRSHRKSTVGGKARFGLTRMMNRKMKFTKSCHSLKTINTDVSKYDYVFLSPVFDSISKDSYKSKFSLTEIQKTLENSSQTVYALGGVNPSNVEVAMAAGFNGIALLGYIWESDVNPIHAYQEIKELVQEIEKKKLLNDQ